MILWLGRKRLQDSPSYPSFGIKGEIDGRVSYKEVSHSPFTCHSFPRYLIIFQDIFVGYRGYKGIRPDTGKELPEPLFHFGYGLSYTTFEYSELEIETTPSKTNFNVKFSVKNTGDMAGKEAAQLYITQQRPPHGVQRPAKELKGFSKVSLMPKEKKKVEIALGKDAFSFYDVTRKAWVAHKGSYEVKVGSSLENIELMGHIILKETFVWNGL